MRVKGSIKVPTNQPTDSRDDDDPSSGTGCSLFILNYFPVCFSHSPQPAPHHLLCVPVPPDGCGVEGGRRCFLCCAAPSMIDATLQSRRCFTPSSHIHSRHCRDRRTEPISWQQRSLVFFKCTPYTPSCSTESRSWPTLRP